MSLANKKLIIDGQIFQTEARDRGMGRYSVRLIQALLNENHDYREVEILLTTNLPTAKNDIKLLQDTFAGAGLKSFNLYVTLNNRFENAIAHNEKLIEDYVNSQRAKGFDVDFLIPSLFQEPIVSVFPANARKLLIFYDLIPYLYHRRYEPVMPFDNYLKRFKYIFAADQVFTISQAVADDLSVYLGIPRDRLVRIDGAAIKADIRPEKPTIPIPDKYILMPTSDDPRKNNLRAVLGFEEYRATEGDSDITLVITSKIKKREKEHLQMFSKNIQFTGNLPDEQLDWLYEHSSAVLFTPEYEGLGLPILEGVEYGKSIVCSSISVFKEISETAFSFCDYENSSSIAKALKEAMSTKPQAREYKKIQDHYTWQKTAERIITATKAPLRHKADVRPKIAIFTPEPEGYSAVGKVVAESHAEMSEYFDIDYYFESGLHKASARPNFLQNIAPSHPATSFGVKSYRNYDAVIYHIGNGDYHLESIKNALYLPGYVVIHDTKIPEAYRVLGETQMMAPDRIEAENLLDAEVKSAATKNLSSVLSRQLGVIVHSQYAAKAVKQAIANSTDIKEVNLPTSVPQLPTYKQNEKIVIGLAGIIADIKGIEVIESIAKDPSFNNCLIRLFGFSHATQATIDRLNSYENISVSTSLTDYEFQTNLSKLHVFMNFRLGYNGETSLSTIEAMRHGVVVIVRDTGWYGELPDEVVLKAQSADEAIVYLRDLIVSSKTISEIGSNAKRYISGSFNHNQYALGVKQLIESQELGTDLNHKLAKQIRSGKIRSKKQYVKFLRENL